jgi:Grx4 family monothiol glutaredoxin
VRQGLKTYSKWPTFPQLYVNSELIGGLDIVKEMRGAPGALKTELGLAAADDMPTPATATLDDRLRSLVGQKRVMVFIKGTPDAPRCGFSSKLVAILKEEGFVFGSFDILEDEEVRQGLKAYSKWPTYPQIYVDSELIGGLDIVEELRASGELSALKA